MLRIAHFAGGITGSSGAGSRTRATVRDDVETTDEVDRDLIRDVVRRVEPGATLARTWEVAGGVSAQVTAIEFLHSDGRATKAIVRRHGAADRARNPHIARDEFRVLEIARARGIGVPRPLLFDESCEVLPTPYVVVEFVEGETAFAPDDPAGFATVAADQLAIIHGVRRSSDLAFLPEIGRGFGERPAVLDATMGEDRIRKALEAAWPLVRVNEAVLLHGDFWPGNLLWRDGCLVAVIDWEDAAIGDPLADLANGRLEFLWWLGNEAMNALTEHYRLLTRRDVAQLAYWDLCAALRPCSKLSNWGLDEETECRLRGRHQQFVTCALDALSFW